MTKSPTPLKEMNGDGLAASMKTILNPAIDNPRARELRRQFSEMLAESSSAGLSEAHTQITATSLPDSLLTSGSVSIAVPSTVGPTTPADELRAALMAKTPIRGTRRIEGVAIVT